MNYRDINLHDAIDEKKWIEASKRYTEAKSLRDRYMYNASGKEFENIVDMLLKEGVLLSADKSNPNIWSPNYDGYTAEFALYIWREAVLPSIGSNYDEFRAMDALDRMAKNKFGGLKKIS
jgi:hypothetical protein